MRVLCSAAAAFAFAILATASAAHAQRDPNNPGVPELRARYGGYLQVQYRTREDADVAQFDEDGFRLPRSRFRFGASRDMDELDVDLDVEAETTPEATLLDAVMTLRAPLPADGTLRLQLGQFKAPVVRETMLSDAAVGFVNKAELASLGPDRQLGAALTVEVPRVPRLEVALGAFNGDGKNLVENVDQRFLFTGRVAGRILGPSTRPTDGGFGPTRLVAAVSAARNVRDLGDHDETIGYLGFDVSGAWEGLSGAVEYLLVDHAFEEGAPDVAYQAYGWNAQLAYLLPLPGRLWRRFEVGARWEAIDRNDTLLIQGPGDPNQTLLYYTLGLGYYHRQHALKAQLALSHIQEYEDRDRNDDDATYDNDTLLLQVTYVIE